MIRFDVAADFKTHTTDHVLTVVRDDGVYRHLRCRQPGTSMWGWDIITWPGYLTITGELDEWVFTRELDMLRDFFRGDVNPYWLQKCTAWDRYSHRNGVVSLPRILSHFGGDDGWVDGEPSAEDLEALTLLEGTGDASRATEILKEYHSDAWDWDITEPDSHAVRALHAIKWTQTAYLKAKGGL